MVRVPVIQTRGLNKASNRQLKGIFVGAARTALRCRRPNALLEAYERIVESGTKPNLARQRLYAVLGRLLSLHADLLNASTRCLRSDDPPA